MRLTLAARSVPISCLHRSDRGSQYAVKVYRDYLADDVEGSMGRRGNPYDNAKAESFMKTLKVERVYPMAFDSLRINTPGGWSIKIPDPVDP